MPAHFEIFNQFITKYVDFTATELVDLNKKCTKVEFAKGDIIIKAGEVQENIYFITKGIIRNYVENSKGEIKIYNFRSEYMTVTGYALYNYEENLKALVNVECLENCIMIEMPIMVINYVINNMKLGDRLGRFMAEAHVVQMLHYVLQRDTKSIIERLDSIDKSFPNIHQRVPQYMIASYLGITPVHLSNLKKRRKSI
ncbi:MAG: Crp/Fnr family transcriptional regulator [Chitinophagaceae bacterium]|nr:Crp/Fnr family transcriptional regulator [Chitinophagaceae bacterium]